MKLGRRARLWLVAVLFVVAGGLWWNGGIVGLLPVDLQFMHLLVIDGQLKRDRENPSAWGRLSLPARTQRVESNYRKFLRRHPDHARGMVAYGCFLAENHREKEAAVMWEQAIATEPNLAVAYNNLGEQYTHSGQTMRGLEYIQKARELEPHSAAFHYNWAMTCSSYRNEAKQLYGWNTDEIMRRSLDAFRTARDLAPQDVAYSSAYAEMFYFTPQPDWPEAYQAWLFCLAQPLEAVDRERTYGRLARICMHLQRFDEATDWLAKMQLEETKSFRTALERKRLVLLRGEADSLSGGRMMRAISDVPMAQ